MGTGGILPHARSMAPLLEVQNLRVAYASARGGLTPALTGVNFEISAGEIVGILGESGSGKSTLAVALLNLLPPNAVSQSGAVLFENKDLLRATPRELQSLRGSRLSLIFQEPSLALHPTLRMQQQVTDVIAAHTSLSREARREKAMYALEKVFGPDAPRVARSYPHELSGGQRQRVLLAQALACNPALLIADEPTASLDPTTQREILQLFRQIRAQLNLSILFITHNPLLLDALADRILVLYAGRVIESGPAAQILASPQHPYTAALLQSLPSASAATRTNPARHLPAIPGEPPDLSQPASGCRFEPRCSFKMPVCTTAEPGLLSIGQSRSASCFKFSAAR